MEKKIFVTTSWDDGHILDKQLVKLLDKYSLKGTFYIPKCGAFETLSQGNKQELEKQGISNESLGVTDICEISKKHEIGAHTVSHPYLSKLAWQEAEKEVHGSKEYLEKILGQTVRMFCYPRGDYNLETEKIVKAAGFLGARTTEMGVTSYPKNQFAFSTTLQVYPRPVEIRLHKTYALPQKGIFSWENQAKRHFNRVLNKGGVFHIWGHSWEVEKLKMWDRLEAIFKYISNQAQVEYTTNGRCLESLGFK